MADTGARRRSLIVLVLAVLAIIAFFAVLFTVSRSDPAADLLTRVEGIVPASVDVDVAGSDVFLSGTYDGVVDDLVATVTSVDGVGRVFADDLFAASAATSTVPPTTVTPTTAPPPEVELEAPRFLFRYDRESASVDGLIADEEIVQEVELALRRLVGRNGYDLDLRVGIVDDAPWITGLPIAVAAAENVDVLELEVDGDSAQVSGIARDQAGADAMMAELTNALGFRPFGTIDTRDIGGQLTALLRGVTTFETGSAVLSDEGMAILDEAAELLLGGPDTLIKVIGHTDSVGDRQFNQLLSEDRAQAVVDYLIAQGVDESQLIALGRGETMPIADNDTEEGRAQNRRIEFVVGG